MTAAHSASDELRAACRRVLRDRHPLTLLEASEDEKRALWEELTGLGWASVLIPADLGGVGWGWREGSIVAQELGRALAPVPFLSNALVASSGLREITHPEAASTLRGIAGGALRVAVAGMESPRPRAATLVIDGRGRLRGCSEFVLDAVEADRIVAVAEKDGAAVLAIADAGCAEIHRLELVDRSRAAGSVTFEEAPAAVLAEADQARRAIAAMRRASTLGLSCDALGGAGFVLEQAIEYANSRVQFDRPIGSFQAVKHRLANLYVLLQGTTAIVEAAVADGGQSSQADRDPAPNRRGAVDSVAHAYSADAYARIAGDAILVHGAIGFTWEHTLHRYLKRAILNQHLGGSIRHHRNRHLEARLASLGVAC